MARPASMHQLGSGVFNKSINMIIYSYPGEGKSPLWGSGGDNVLFLDSDNGTESAEMLGSRAWVIPAHDYDDLEGAYQYVKNEMPKDLPHIRWVVWDSITLFSDRALIDDLMPDAVAGSTKDREEFVPDRREYLINQNRIGRYVRNFADLPVNFGISALLQVDIDQQDGSTVYMPAIPGKNMPSKVCGYMNVIGFLGKATVENSDGKAIKVQRLLTQRTGKYFARDRFMALGHHVDRPTIPKIEGLIEAKKAMVNAERKAGGPAPSSPVRKAVAKKAAAPVKKVAPKRVAATTSK